MASTLCTRMRLLVTVDNYNHTHEHLFELACNTPKSPISRFSDSVIPQCQTAGMGGAL